MTLPYPYTLHPVLISVSHNLVYMAEVRVVLACATLNVMRMAELQQRLPASRALSCSTETVHGMHPV